MKINKLVGFILSTILLNNVVESMETVHESNNKPSKLEIEQNNLELDLVIKKSKLEDEIQQFAEIINYNDPFQIQFVNNFFDNMLDDYGKNPSSFFEKNSIEKLCKNYDKDSCDAIYNNLLGIDVKQLMQRIMKTKLEIHNTNNKLNNIKSEIEIKRIQHEDARQKQLEELQKKNRRALENKQQEINKLFEEIDNINKQINDINVKIEGNKAKIFDELFNKVKVDGYKINQIMGNLDTVLAVDYLQELIINYVPNTNSNKKQPDPSFKGSAKEAWNNFTDKKFWKDTWNDVTGNKKNNNQNNNINYNNNDLRNALRENSCIELYDDKIIENMKNIIRFNKDLNRLQSKLEPLESKLKELKEK